ncbi:hypothetical protein ACFLZB_03680 [Nanoarchaeota archaeon]
MKPDSIVQELEQRLPEIAREIIKKNTQLPEENRERFHQDPDSVEENKPNWHQWGIITHSKKFREIYDTEIADYLKIDSLEKEIDSIPKKELIRISIPLHDLGKFQKTIKGEKSDFSNHERKSQEIILNSDLLKEYGLTNRQIEYIARCAGNHYQLGFVRSIAKRSDLKYTLRFVKDPAFARTIKHYLPKFKGFEPEIGLLFLADSLAKTDIIIPAETDAEIQQYTAQVEQEIQRRKLNPNLIYAIKQRPVNIAVGKEYLRKLEK